jgi:hypothetical protein
MIHEYTLKTAEPQRQLVDNDGQPLRFMRYLHAEAAMKYRKNLFLHAQGGPEKLSDDVDLIICTAGINWDVSLTPLHPPGEAMSSPVNTTAQRAPVPPRTTMTMTNAPAHTQTQTPPRTSPAPAATAEKKASTSSATSARALSVACPTCHQQPGSLCTTKDGKPTPSHKLRLAAATATVASELTSNSSTIIHEQSSGNAA